MQCDGLLNGIEELKKKHQKEIDDLMKEHMDKDKQYQIELERKNVEINDLII